MNTIPIFFVLFIVFIIYVQVKMKQGAKTPQWNQSFWSKEKASNFARKKDISELDYLEVDQNSAAMGRSGRRCYTRRPG